MDTGLVAIRKILTANRIVGNEGMEVAILGQCRYRSYVKYQAIICGVRHRLNKHLEQELKENDFY